MQSSAAMRGVASSHTPCCGPARRPQQCRCQAPLSAAAATTATRCHVPIPRAGRTTAMDIRCATKARVPAGGRRVARGRAGGGGARRGFGKEERRAQQEPWETNMPPMYRAYYKPGFKPPRFLGPMELMKSPDGTVDVVTSEEVVASQLLAVSPPLVFLEGSFGTAPDVEELHSALLARGTDGVPAAVARVLHLLPRAVEGGGDDNTDESSRGSGDTDQGMVDVAGPSFRAPLAAAASIQDLDPKVWAARANARALPSSSPPGEVPAAGELLRALQASSYSEDYADPASSQLRHELPSGFIGVWPEVAAMAHSCAPNVAVAVISGGYAFVHSAKDLQVGEPLTFNKIGAAVLGPLAVRQAAVRALTGAGCRCERCLQEEALPEEARAELAELHQRVEGEWAAALEAAAAAGDEEALAQLWEEVTLDVDSLWETLAAAGQEGEDADTMAAGAYGAFELAWSLEELTQPVPDAARLAAAVRMLRAAAPGGESHVAAALQLHDLATARVAELLKSQGGRKQRTSAQEKRLLSKVVAANQEAEGSLIAFYEAMFVRYGFIPEEGLLPQLTSALQLFYAGLEQMGASAAGDASGDAGRELLFDGIPVTVVDRPMGSASGAGASPEFEMSSGGGSSSGGLRLSVVPVPMAEDGGSGGLMVAGDGGDVDADVAAAVEGSMYEDGPLIEGSGEGVDGGPEAFLAP